MLADQWSPDAVETVIRFVNTRADGAGHVEQFGTAADFAAWAVDHALLADDVVVTDSDAAAARELRTALVTLLLAHAGDTEIDRTQVDHAERYLEQAGARYPLAATITLDGTRLTSGCHGVPGVLASVLAAAAELAQRGDWGRTKACCNQPCHQGFNDRTRNQSGRYCSPGCRSQASMRSFRQRRRTDA